MRNYRFCPFCGSNLINKRLNQQAWLRFYQCDSDDCKELFVEVMDLKNQYPLVQTNPNLLDRFNTLSKIQADEAVSKIRRIDFKTLSLVDFESYCLEHSSEV